MLIMIVMNRGSMIQLELIKFEIIFPINNVALLNLLIMYGAYCISQ